MVQIVIHSFNLSIHFHVFGIFFDNHKQKIIIMGDYYGRGGGGNNHHNHPKGGGGPTTSTSTTMMMDSGKIFVGGLSWQTSEESLRFHFERYGTVVSVEVMRDRVTGDPRGFAFVVFADPSTVDLVMSEPHPHEINHKVVDVKRAQARGIAPLSIHQGGVGGGAPTATTTPSTGGGTTVTGGGGGFGVGGGGGRPIKTESTTTTTTATTKTELSPEQAQAKVFVGGIPPHVDRDELRTIFMQFGPVTDAIVMVDQTTQRSRGFGFVTFEHDSNGAHNAVAAQPLQIGGRRVEVKLATPRSEQNSGGGPQSATNAAAAANAGGGGGHQRSTAAALMPSKHVGLRAGQTTSTGEFAGLAVSYGRSGWKAGYGSKAFGRMGWSVQGWDDGGPAPEKTGFSFATLWQRMSTATAAAERPSKRSRKG